MSVEAVLHSQRGLIVAPAGCGKTHLITDTLGVSPRKPYLVLTHTTAGVAALKQRLRRLSVPPQNYVVTTIDGWALRFANYFPGLCPIRSKPEQGNAFYPELRITVLNALRAGQITEIIHASYSRLLVDEYQDCNVDQHQLIQELSTTLPTVVFGDPMQCIFNFGGPMPDWTASVQEYFPVLNTLDVPWRWNNSETPELGEWILQCREMLLEGQQIDLNASPANVNYVELTGSKAIDSQNQRNVHYSILQDHPDESLLIMGNSRSPRSRHLFAQQTRSLDVVEPVELSDVIKAASSFDGTDGRHLIQHLLNAASEMMTNVEVAKTLQRLDTIQSGRNRTPPSPLEHTLMLLSQDASRTGLVEALQLLETKPGTRIYRKAAFSALKDSLSQAVTCPEQTIREAASKIREQRRHEGDRRIPRRAIGSTLLLKGLECDHSLILDAGEMNAKHLYVALSRGAKSVTVFSRGRFIGS